MDGIIKFEIKGKDGTGREYHLRPLQRLEAMEMGDVVAKAGLVATLQGIDTVIKAGSAKRADIDLAGIAESIVRTLPFAVHWDLASRMMTGGEVVSKTKDPIAIINGEPTCTVEFTNFDTDGADYFRESLSEYYEALFKAVNGNWPGFFIDLRAKVGAFMRTLLPGKKSTESTE